MIDTKLVINKLQEYIQEIYLADTDEPFNIHKKKFLWSSKYHGEPTYAIYLTDTEIDDNRLLIQGMYWSKFGQITINKGNAKVSRRRQISDTQAGSPISMEIYSEPYKYRKSLIYFNIYYSGVKSNTVLIIDEDGEVNFFKHPTYEDCTDTLIDAITALSEYLKVRLSQIIEDEILGVD